MKTLAIELRKEKRTGVIPVPVSYTHLVKVRTGECRCQVEVVP